MMGLDTDAESGARISEDGTYRYSLWRYWSEEPPMVWIMLNPSTADGNVDDPTIRRCMGFARREGCGGIEVLNLYALRATDPVALADHPCPEGPDNDDVWHLVLTAWADKSPVVAAWGAFVRPLENKGTFSWALVNADKTGWKCLGKTKDGSPRHPLYVRGDQPLVDLL